MQMHRVWQQHQKTYNTGFGGVQNVESFVETPVSSPTEYKLKLFLSYHMEERKGHKLHTHHCYEDK